MRDLINVVVKFRCGCYIAGVYMNLLEYADGIVLLSPSWRGLQKLLNIIEKAAAAVEMTFNTKKTVYMVANPYEKNRWLSQRFSQFALANCSLLLGSAWVLVKCGIAECGTQFILLSF